MRGDISQNLSSIKNIRFVKQLVSTGIIFINQEVLHYIDTCLTENLMDSPAGPDQQVFSCHF